jgi:predicted amidohydrolase
MSASNPAPFKVAAVEFNPQLFEFEKNIPPLCAIVEEAARAGAKIIVLPETATSGYIYKDRKQFEPYLDSIPGRTTDALSVLTAKYDCYVTVGIAEIDRATGLAFNSGALVGPRGYIGKYRKVGLNPDDVKWFSPGNIGYPVFDTPYGKLAMEICYDDTYWEVARTAALKGAQIICFMSSSDRALAREPESVANHSTISAVQEINAWNGVALIATDRNNSETNPTTGLTVFYGGLASVWSPRGQKIAQAPASSPEVGPDVPPRILYAEIDPADYDNAAQASFAERRPELYGPLAFYRAPTDHNACLERHAVQGVVVQFVPVPGDRAANTAKISRLLAGVRPASTSGRLIVLPEYTLTGVPVDAAAARAAAESVNGSAVQTFALWANQHAAHVVGSFVLEEDGKLYAASVLVGPDGRVIGTYRKTHLDAEEKAWAAAGEEFSVFDTAIGRIGMMMGGEARFPECSGTLGVLRADIIAHPTSWRGQYGVWLQIAPDLFAERYPENTMALWYGMAKSTQAYTLVANFSGGDYLGSSGLFTLNPVDAPDPPVTAPKDAETALSVEFTTQAEPDWWMSQQKLVTGRRVDLCAPLVFPMDSEVFTQWRDTPGFDLSIWQQFRQAP